MSKIEFTKEEAELLIDKIKIYFREELDQEIGAFPARFLLDFFTEEVGPFYYNKGLADAHTFIESKIEQMTDELYWLR